MQSIFDEFAPQTSHSVRRGRRRPPEVCSVPRLLRAPGGAIEQKEKPYNLYGAPPGTRTLDPLIKSQLHVSPPDAEAIFRVFVARRGSISPSTHRFGRFRFKKQLSVVFCSLQLS